MNRTLHDLVVEFVDSPDIKAWIADIEEAIAAKRGPKRELSVRTLLIAKLYGMWMHQSGDMRNGAMGLFNDLEDDDDFRRLGLANNVSYDMVTDLQRHITDAMTPAAGTDLTALDSFLQQSIDTFARAAVGDALPDLDRHHLAIDTTLIQAHCTSRGCKEPEDGAKDRQLTLVADEYRELEFDEVADRHADAVADVVPSKVTPKKAKPKPPKATRGSCDPHAGHRAYTKPDGTLKKKILGYGCVALVESTPNSPEFVLRAALIPAHKNDVPVGSDLVMGLTELYPSIDPLATTATADRAFNNQWKAFSEPLVDAGFQFTYDLMATDRFIADPKHPDRKPATYRGFLQICGRLFAPHMPPRLWEITVPGPLASNDEWDAYWAQEDERAAYELRLNGKPTGGTARLRSGTHDKVRAWRCKHEAMWPKTKDWDPALPLCLGDHEDDEACCLQNLTVHFADMPRVWQWPAYGTREWKALYNMRSAVERLFSSLKYNCGWSPGRAKVRGIGAVGFSLMLALAVHNLRLRYPEARHAANRPRIPKAA